MPVIFYSTYSAVSDSPREVTVLEHRLGRELLSAAVESEYGVRIRAGDIGVGENGKPFLTGHRGIHFNISHCDGLVVCALDVDPVGVDAERPGYFAEILVKKVLAVPERRFLEDAAEAGLDRQEWFFRFWTLKEAYVKRTGIGVDTDLHAFSFSFTEEAGGGYSVVCSDGSVECCQVKLPSGHIVSVCFTGEKPISFRRMSV